MALDKYGTGQDNYCYEGSNVLINLLGITDEKALQKAEQDLTELTALDIELKLPPYNVDYLCNIHQRLFEDIYAWAGEFRSIDISKGDTRFCNCSRIEAEAKKLFRELSNVNFFLDDTREELVAHAAELYVELNMIHPFRDGNGRAQRILFEHIIINCGYEFSLDSINENEWIQANVSGVNCDYGPMIGIFDKCIGQKLG